MYQINHQQQQQEASYTDNIPYYSSLPPINSIPNNPPNPPPPIRFQSLSSDPYFSYHPPIPSFTPYPNSSPYSLSVTPNVAVFEEQQKSSFYEDPNAVSANWVVKQAPPIKYSPAIQPLNKEAIAATSYDASLTSSGVSKMLVRNAPKVKLNRPKAKLKKKSTGQSVRCELCKIDCTDIQLYEKHIAGRKHTKNILKVCAPKVTSSEQQASQLINVGRGSGEHSTPGGQGIPGVPNVPADLELKKQKLLEGGAAVQSVRVCRICNVACNGEIVYADHLAGKKHIAKEQALRSMANPNPISVCNPETKSQEKTTEKSKNGSPVWCEVCKISCTSSEGLIIHTLGKKHKKNLEKLGNSKKDAPASASASTAMASSAMNLPTVVRENAEPNEATVAKLQKVKKTKEPEDVETKKRKVLEGGAAANAVRTCTICNVVCNSDTVFNFHLAGQKHAAMVKQAKAGMTATGSQ